jgi:hypothetical protein
MELLFFPVLTVTAVNFRLRSLSSSLLFFNNRGRSKSEPGRSALRGAKDRRNDDAELVLPCILMHRHGTAAVCDSLRSIGGIMAVGTLPKCPTGPTAPPPLQPPSPHLPRRPACHYALPCS